MRSPMYRGSARWQGMQVQQQQQQLYRVECGSAIQQSSRLPPTPTPSLYRAYDSEILSLIPTRRAKIWDVDFMNRSRKTDC
jgi:hypothetical protein